MPGFTLKKLNFLDEKEGSTLFKLIFYAGMPALIFKSITTSQIDVSFLIRAIFPTIMVLLSFLIGLGVRKTILQEIDI
jgi:predicted permease